MGDWEIWTASVAAGTAALREPDDERRSFAGLALGLDRAVVLEDDVLGDGQAEAGAAGLLGAALVDAVEAVEDLFPLALLDSLAVVAHAHLGGRAALGHLDLDRLPLTVLDGVVDQVRERLLDAQRVGAHEDALARHQERPAVGEVLAQLVDELAEVDALPGQHQVARLD